MPNVEGATVTLKPTQLFTPDRNLVEFINVAHALARFQTNPAVDAALVQFFLRRIYSADPTLSTPKNTKPVAVDGVFGPITETWVKHFQSHADIQDRINPRKFVPLRADGVVDRAPGNTLPARQFAIYRLNWAMASNEPGAYALLLESARKGLLSVTGLASVPVPVPRPIPGP